MNIINYSFNVKETDDFYKFIKKLESFGKTETNGDFLTLTLKDNAGVLVFNLKVRSIQAQKVHIEKIDFETIKTIYFKYLSDLAKASESIKSMSLIKTNDVNMASNIIDKMNSFGSLNYTEINGDIFVNINGRISETSRYSGEDYQTPLGYLKDDRVYRLTSGIEIKDRITNLSYGEEVIEYSYEYNIYENIRSWGYPADLLTYQGSYYLWENDFNNGPVFDISKNHKVICVNKDSFVSESLKKLENGSFEIINNGTTIKYYDIHDRTILESISSYEEIPNGYRLDPYEICYFAYGGYKISSFSNTQAPTYKIGDILLYDNNSNELVTSNYTDYEGSYNIIGVCCIPSNILPDKKARFITSETIESTWGYFNKDSQLQNKTFIDHIVNIENQNEYVGLSSTGFIPTDYNKEVPSLLNNRLHYSLPDGVGVPALYLNDWTLNEELFSYNTSSYSMLTDCDGKYNQDVMKFTLGLDEAFNKCYNYSSIGTYSGEWYLPSFVELALLNTRIQEVNDILGYIHLNTIDPRAEYISSTEFDTSRCIVIDFGLGRYDKCLKDKEYKVIPFFKY